MELREFIERYGGQLAARIEQNMSYVYNPLKPEGVSEYESRMPALLRKPFPVQGEVIKGLSKALYQGGQNHLFLVGEMGTGKTMISLSAIFMAPRPMRILVVCPGHLVEKWIREAKQTIPGVEVVNLSGKNAISILDGLKGIRSKPSNHEIYVISKERAKLGYGWKPAYAKRKVDKFPRCPKCGKIPSDGKDNLLNMNDLGTRRRFCACGEALWQADSKLRRYPPSEYIKKYLKNFFDMVILDEIQDYKAGGSLQGQAMGMLVRGQTKCLCLTGTLNGGYADDIFYLLYRMAPGAVKADGFKFGQSRVWMEAYGTIEYERKIEAEDNYYGRGSRKGVVTKKRPGVSPLVIGKYLLDRSCFIRLSDVIEGLPPYEERVVALKMDERQAEEYKAFESELKAAVKSNGLRALASMLQALLSYPDSCVAFEEEVLIRDKYGEVVDKISAPLLRGLTLPKEEELVRMVKEEVAEGRKVLCYLTFTGTRDIRPRLQEVLEKAGLRVGVLDVSVEPQKREAWIQKHAPNIDVLLVNAELVKTGLDLYEFPTVIFFQTGYNIFTLRQAARRSWRIGQTKPVRVYFFCYQETMQEVALSLIAKKLEVALIVEGDLPEGLAEYALDTSSIIEEMGKALVEGGTFQGAEAAWANFRKKEIEVQLGITQKEKVFEETTTVSKGATDKMNVRTSIDKNVVVKVSVIEGKKKKTSAVEVKYGDLEEVSQGKPVQFCLF